MCGITFEIYHELCGEGKLHKPAKQFIGACEVPNPHWARVELRQALLRCPRAPALPHAVSDRRDAFSPAHNNEP
ncbi:hypothetical protein MSG28_002570 [Choristoneura fumiferana]|uniref:Uncharacterized protein n=1 Tax=Choristoneura fumiferana TaxID=7141 RepID=A0ACC0JWJ8_CHOFU|nr:hypothetical protein MSG28_002570 [Choristoneura fumiferana]